MQTLVIYESMYGNTHAIAAAIGTATVAALLAGGAPAHAQVIDHAWKTATFTASVTIRSNLIPSQTDTTTAKVSRSGKASYATVTGGGHSAQARAQCQRRDGRTNWYQSTIRSRIINGFYGPSSHYDCGNNATYDYKLVGLGVDIN